MSFPQQGPKGICILSANGAVSNVTLRQASTSGGTVTYEVSERTPSEALYNDLPSKSYILLGFWFINYISPNDSFYPLHLGSWSDISRFHIIDMISLLVIGLL